MLSTSLGSPKFKRGKKSDGYLIFVVVVVVVVVVGGGGLGS